MLLAASVIGYFSAGIMHGDGHYLIRFYTNIWICS